MQLNGKLPAPTGRFGRWERDSQSTPSMTARKRFARTWRASR
jgi:hypothetical protein